MPINFNYPLTIQTENNWYICINKKSKIMEIIINEAALRFEGDMSDNAPVILKHFDDADGYCVRTQEFISVEAMKEAIKEIDRLKAEGYLPKE